MEVVVELKQDSEGRYIGDDGFVVPKNFHEFHSRYPHWAGMMARKWLPNATPEDVEDLAGDITCSLLRLRTVERYDPSALGVTNAKLFFAWMVTCSRNVAFSRHKDAKSQPTNNKANVFLDGLDVSEDGVSADRVLHDAKPSTSRDVIDLMLLDGFGKFLETQGHDSLAKFYQRMREGHTQGEAGVMAGIGDRAWWPMQRLKALAKRYTRRRDE